MRVLMFDAGYPPPVVGGKEKQAHLLASALALDGLRVEALSYKHNGNSSSLHENIFVERVAKNAFSSLFVLLKIFQKRKYFDILHIHTPSKVGKILAIFGKLFGYRVVFKFTSSNLLDDCSIVDKLLWHFLFKHVNSFVVLEEKTQKKLIIQAVSEDKIFTVPNGVVMQERRECKNARYIKILFIARLIADKKCEDAIRACALLNNDKNNIRAKLYIVGDGDQSEYLHQLVAEDGLSHVVEFLGYREDTINLMQQSDVLVSTSAREGMSNVILEAMSVGLPVVSTDVGAAKYQLGVYAKKFLCPVGNPREIAERLRCLYDENIAKEYGEYLHQRCKDKFSIESVALKYIKKYQEIL